jgi:Helicase conserved C-terminal domain
MKIVDLRKLPRDLDSVITDTKEALVDALLNRTWERCSGSGSEGSFVYGVKPSQRFVSGFLLPRFDELGVEDETSDIHISAHGLDFQLLSSTHGNVIVDVRLSIYVRVLPEWSELTNPSLDIMPQPPIRRDIQSLITDATRQRLTVEFTEEMRKAPDSRKARRIAQQRIYREELLKYGVRVSEDGVVATIENDAKSDGDPADASGSKDVNEADAGSELSAQGGRLIFDRGDFAQPVDIPQKWMRLQIEMAPFEFLLQEPERISTLTIDWSRRLRQTIASTVVAWLGSEKGQRLALRPGTVLPNNVASEAAWNAFLAALRSAAPKLTDLLPQLDDLALNVALTSDLRDATRSNLRILLENNSRDVRKRHRDRFEHAVHQVGLRVALPRAAHRPLRLDRVESSYRFRQFLFYPAIGVNCGVSEHVQNDRLFLATEWMPRYFQPRIIPNEIDGVPTDFATLGASGFDPNRLSPFIAAFEDWVNTQETKVDPTDGTESAADADRERIRFRKDIAAYRYEIHRISLGIELLLTSFAAFQKDDAGRNAIPYRAWILLNRTFERAGAMRGVSSWRLFQLAFVLAHLSTLSSRMKEYANGHWFNPAFDEETATLLYFATGGGKSEAFFGLLVYNLFLDRLRGKLVGVTALVRYPLRLLTLQQAQRLLSLLVHAELVRLEIRLPGRPFEIGFWVGSTNTPNSTDDPALSAIPTVRRFNEETDADLTTDYKEANKSFNKIPSCPLCSGLTALRRIKMPTSDEIVIVCQNQTCLWNERTSFQPLPFLIIDQDIYRHGPSVLLGVIDKLALIGQHPSTITKIVGMFGLSKWVERDSGRLVSPSHKMLEEGPERYQCEVVAPAYSGGRELFEDPFPSLVIQDEAHLLEESLGTFAGLFETTLEQLFHRLSSLLGDRVARQPHRPETPRLPKTVAATATVSVPRQQFAALYQRDFMQFPYPGTSIFESFYAKPAVPADPARRVLGGESPLAPETQAPWMRVYTSIMTNGRNHTVTTVVVLSAYHLAITELWEDLQDDKKRTQAIAGLTDSISRNGPLSELHRAVLNKVAAASPETLLSLVDLLRISLTYVTNKKGGDQVIEAFGEEVAKFHRRHGRSLDRLRSRLISGGIDVAEIQEIMSEAEAVPEDDGNGGLDLASSLRSIVATSAISHGVDIDKFNAMFFAGMPSDIAEFIQASSRVGRTHVGFSLLIPTPHSRRDRYIVETHDIFHRFLERMIAAPAITRWAASAHDRVLASLFQTWLCGWVEQKLFVDADVAGKLRFPRFTNVGDIGRLIEGREYPNAVKDFTEFAVEAVGVRGRGIAAIGAAPQRAYYDDRIRNRAKDMIEQFRGQYSTTTLSDYWRGPMVGTRPMLSLRDIDEAGHFELARGYGQGRNRLTSEEQDRILTKALRIVRRQRTTVAELDPEEV